MSLNGGYAMIKYNSTQEELQIAYRSKKPALFYDENQRAHWALIEETETESIDEETQEPITLYEYSYRLIDEASSVVANPNLSGDEATLDGVEIDGTKYKVGGSGGKEYFHCIRYYNDGFNQAYINIKNNSSEPFTIVSLCKYIGNLGCTSFRELFVCSGMAQFDNIGESIIGCYMQNSSSLKVDTYNNHETSFGNITDTVTEVL